MDGRRQNNLRLSSPVQRAPYRAYYFIAHRLDQRKRPINGRFSPLIHLADGFLWFAIKASTTEGSASVDVSPRFSKSFAAIFLRIRRMTFPDLVFGKASAHWI